MTEIRLEFFYAHPPERVWSAMTESRLLATWLAENNLVPRPGQQFKLRPVDVAGLGGLINADVIEVVNLNRLDMIWRADDMHLGVTWQLRAQPDGTTVEVTQTGYLGVHGNSRRDALRRLFEEAFDTRLRDVLAGLAEEMERASQAKSRNQRLRVRRDAIPAYAADAGPVDPWAATEPLAADPEPAFLEVPHAPVGEWALGGPRDRGSQEREFETVEEGRAGTAQRSCVGVALLAVLLTAFAVVLTVWIGTPGSPSPSGPNGDGPLIANLPGDQLGGTGAGRSPGPPGSGPTVGPDGQPVAPASPKAESGGGAGAGITPPPSAVMGTEAPASSPTPDSGGSDPEPPASTALAASVTPEYGSYVVTVTNSGAVAANWWTVVITIPGGRPSSVSGAIWSRHGNQLTFTPTGATSTVPAGGSVSFVVAVDGAVVACTIDGRACG